jgi:plastocyanin
MINHEDSDTRAARGEGRPRRGAAPAVAALLAATLLGFGPAPAAAQAEPAASVGMEAMAFAPTTITVRVGDTVRWDNTSDTVHTVTADAGQAADPASVALPAGSEAFDSGFMQPGDSFSHTFGVAGTYTYFCIPHEGAGMIAQVIVEG